MIGKITIIKTLILPQFTHLFTALPKPDITLMKQFKKLLFTFLWGSKREKIKRKIIVRRYEDGGLRMVDLEVYIAALKASWIKRQLMSTHPWTTLFKDVIAEECRIWERNGVLLRAFSKTINNIFWKEVFGAWSSVAEIYPIEGKDLLKVGLWFSNATNKLCMSRLKSWQERGIVRVNDILREDGTLMKFDDLKRMYGIRGTELDYTTLLFSLKSKVKNALGNGIFPNHVVHTIISFVLSRRQVSRHIHI